MYVCTYCRIDQYYLKGKLLLQLSYLDEENGISCGTSDGPLFVNILQPAQVLPKSLILHAQNKKVFWGSSSK